MNTEDRTIAILEEILLWTKYDYSATKQIMLDNLDTDEKKITYQLSDGERSTRDISKQVGVHFSTIAKWWNVWFKLGIMAQTEKYGGSRFKRLISLTIMGINLPEFEVD